MKKLLVSLICLAACATTVLADNGWGFFGSYWKPSDGDSAFGPGLRIAIEMIPGVQLDLRGSYFDNVLDDDVPGKLEVLPLDAMVTLIAPVADRLNVYGGIGFSYYLLDSNGSVDSSEIGFVAGGGVEFVIKENEAFYGATKASLFAEIMYRALNVDLTPRGETESRDLDLDGLGVNFGVMIRW